MKTRPVKFLMKSYVGLLSEERELGGTNNSPCKTVFFNADFELGWNTGVADSK